nr:MAG TPA: hypothetical protein [Caudoviricetes sp.]
MTIPTPVPLFRAALASALRLSTSRWRFLTIYL